MLLLKIEPGAGPVVESAGRERNILFPFLRSGYPGPNPSCAAEDYLSILLRGIPPACGSLGHDQDFVPSNDRSIECFVGGSDLLLLIKIEPGAGPVVESAGRERNILYPFPAFWISWS